jgi:hypothetical protein
MTINNWEGGEIVQAVAYDVPGKVFQNHMNRII